MAEDYSLIRFNLTNFFAVLINSRPFQPISTLLVKLVKALIEAEPEPDGEVKERVEWIYNNTHAKVNVSLSIVELLVFRNLTGNLNREVEIGDKTFKLTQLYKYLDEVSSELSQIVIKISKRYSFDMPMQAMGISSGAQANINLT